MCSYILNIYIWQSMSFHQAKTLIVRDAGRSAKQNVDDVFADDSVTPAGHRWLVSKPMKVLMARAVSRHRRVQRRAEPSTLDFEVLLFLVTWQIKMIRPRSFYVFCFRLGVFITKYIFLHKKINGVVDDSIQIPEEHRSTVINIPVDQARHLLMISQFMMIMLLNAKRMFMDATFKLWISY